MTACTTAEQLVSPVCGKTAEPFLDLVPDATPETEPGPAPDPSYLLRARQMAAMTPGSAPAFARLASAELVTGNETPAGEAAQQAMALVLRSLKGTGARPPGPDLAAVLVAADVLVALGRTRDAEGALASLPADQVPELVGYAELAAQRGDYDVALARLARATGPTAQAFRGWLLLQRGEFAGAVRELRSALDVSPSPSTFINLGYAYAALGSLRKAIRTTEVAVGLSGNATVPLAWFNLVAYLVASGSTTAALDVLRRLGTLRPQDFRVNMARAFVLASTDDKEGALKELRRAKTTQGYFAATAQERAELQANVEVMGLRLGRKTRDSTLKALHEQFVKAQHKSTGIAALMAGLSWSKKDVKLFGAVVEALQRSFSATDLSGFEGQLCMLRGEFEQAAKLFAARAERFPLDEMAATNAVYLLSEGCGDATRALKIGRDALRRFPASVTLANNIAYLLALSGDLSAAKAMLPARDSVAHVKATRGLIEFLSGRVKEGLELYDQAATVAEEAGDERTAALARYRKALLIASSSGEALPAPPAEYEDDVRFQLQRRGAERTRPVVVASLQRPLPQLKH